jgi:predicted AlkP superfamily phosphohydrolase/phosphomutase
MRTLLKSLILLTLLASVAYAAEAPKVVCIGFDGMDPNLLAQFREQGLMPNFDRFIAKGDLKNLGTSIPPQSPVAWSNFTTGMNPGGHGIFDFIHRDPETMMPYLSAAQAMAPQRWWKVGGWKLPRDESIVVNLRQGTAFWERLSEAGVDVTIFKIPSNFPPVDCEAHCLSGMGTPDILGTYGIFTYFTDDMFTNTDLSGGRVETVRIRKNHFESRLYGPVNAYRDGDPETSIPFSAVIDTANHAAVFTLDDKEFLLQEGDWSEWLTLEFDLVPMMKSVSGVCRFYLMEAAPNFRLYVTPVNIDPANPEMPISIPADWSKDLSDAYGPYYTQGLPDDTKALEEDVFDDDAYVSQSNEVISERMVQLKHELATFAPKDSGFLFFYFNIPDQTCHTFWRNMDENSPNHDAHAALHRDRIKNIYQQCDQALGLAMDTLDEETTLIAMSDHGFAPYYRSFHVNRWLLDNGFLALRPGVDPSEVEYLSGIDWRNTRAYAIGINGLYLNQRGRERRGIVNPGEDRELLLQELVEKLEQVVDPQSGKRAIKYAYRTDEVYSGDHIDEAPDINIGYYSGFRGSNESALGEIPVETFVDNMMKWSGDHCMAADEVPGIIVSSRPIDKSDPQLLDMAPTFMRMFGLEPLPEMVGSAIFEGVK